MKKNLLAKLMVGILIIPLLMLLNGCKMVDTDQLNWICNHWNWTKTTGGIGGVNMTPETEKCTKALWLMANGQYVDYKNGQEVKRGSYTLVYQRSMIDQKYHDMIRFDNDSINKIIDTKDKTDLILFDDVIDGFTYRYQKIN